jgi:hypothetical protein
MPAIIVTTPGATIGAFTAAAAAVAQLFTLADRANALVGMIGTNPWQYSTDGVNFVGVPAGVAWMVPVLSGQGTSLSLTVQRVGGADSVVSCFVAG